MDRVRLAEVLSRCEILLMVDQTLASVGPYRFHRALHRSFKLDGKSAGIISPPHRTVKSGSPFHCVSANDFQVTGVACMMLIPCSDMLRDSASGSELLLKLLMITCADWLNGR